jgi:serine carboxypeptidase-like clade 1
VDNIIFIDAPVGAGFSYANDSADYYTTDTKSAAQTYIFLRKVRDPGRESGYLFKC